MATDALERNGLVLAESDCPRRSSALSKVLPAAANIHNPVDVLGDARATAIGAALEAVLKDPGVDGMMVILTPQTGTEIEETARGHSSSASKDSDKPIAGLLYGRRRGGVGASKCWPPNRVPNYPFPERAVAALGAMYRYYRLAASSPSREVESFEVDKAAVANLFAAIRSGGPQHHRRYRGAGHPEGLWHHHPALRPWPPRPTRPWRSAARSATRW